MQHYLTLIALHCFFTFTIAVGQNSLPYPIIHTELFEKDSSKYAVFPYPILPSFVGIPALDAEYLKHECRPYYDLIKQESWQENLMSASTYLPDLALQGSFPISVDFVICGWGNVLPHGDYRESYYLFAIFGEDDERESLMLYAYNYSRWGGGNATPTAIINKIEIVDGDWQKLSSKTYSFTQTIARVSNSSKHTMTKLFNLITVKDQKVYRVIYNLPLASYFWIDTDPQPTFTDQLAINLEYPDSITVKQIGDKLTEEQQKWLGTFSLQLPE